MNWRPFPFVRLLFPLMLGITLSLWLNISVPEFPILYLALLAIVTIFFFWNMDFRYRGAFGVLCSVTLMLIGYGLTFSKNELRGSSHFIHHFSKSDILVGTIKDMPIVGNWVKMQLKVQHIHASVDSSQSASGNLLLYVERNSLSESLNYGDVIALRNVHPTEVEAPKNPHTFDYQRYLHFKNIHYQAFARGDNWQRIATDHGNPVLQTAFSLRKQFLGILAAHLDTTAAFGVGSALILGYKEELSDEVQQAYAETGAMHVLAVSGLHVGLVYLFLNLLLGLVKSENRQWKLAQLVLQLLGIWSFALITGASPSVCRAATMFSFFIVGKFGQRNYNVYNTLAASAFCLLLYNPYLLVDVGFQLSYLAVLGIVYFQPKIYQLWSIENRLGDYMWQLTAVSLAAQLTTFPISLLYFHQFPVYFWLSGLVVIPAAYLILGGGLLLFLIESLVVVPTYWIGKGLYWIISGVNTVIFSLQQLPGGLMQGFWLQPFTTLVLYAILIATVVALHRRIFKWILGTLGLTVFLAGNYAFTELKHAKHRELIIYHIKGHSVLDFVDGEKLVSLQNTDIPEKALQFAVQNNRWALGIEDIQTIDIDSVENFEADNVLYHKGFVQFGEKRIAIYPNTFATGTPPERAIGVDYLLLRQNAEVDIATLQEMYHFKTLVFDVSNDWKTVKRWREECEALEIECYDIRAEGALVEDIGG